MRLGIRKREKGTVCLPKILVLTRGPGRDRVEGVVPVAVALQEFPRAHGDVTAGVARERLRQYKRVLEYVSRYGIR